jgi:hypothetical protein
MPNGSKVLTAEVAKHVLFHYGEQDGQEGGGFTKALLLAFMRADRQNFARLSAAFPEYGAAMDLAKNVNGGIDALKILAKEED